MLALITGASSGIGFEIAKELSKKGYKIIAVGRNGKRLENLKKVCKEEVYIEKLDLSDLKECKVLYEKYKDEKVDILVNSAGIGKIGEFIQTDFEQDLEMINLNILAVHYMTKVFLNKMINQNEGYILNVSSSAAFAPGPLMASYYATKDYVFKLTESISKELKKSKSNVSVSVVCPGPVDTDFNKKMNVKFSVKPVSPGDVAKYSLKKLFQKKTIIIPGIKNKIGVIFSKILSHNILEEYIYNMQFKKLN